MKTPVKYGYGKRKRLSSTSNLQWDETIDVVASSKDSDELAITPVTTSSKKRTLSPHIESQRLFTPKDEDNTHALGNIYDFEDNQPVTSHRKHTNGKKNSKLTEQSPTAQSRQARSNRAPVVLKQDLDADSRGRRVKAESFQSIKFEKDAPTNLTRKSPRSHIEGREKGKQKASYIEVESNVSELNTDTTESDKLQSEKYEADLQEALKRSRLNATQDAAEGSGILKRDPPSKRRKASQNPFKPVESTLETVEMTAPSNQQVLDTETVAISSSMSAASEEDDLVHGKEFPLSSEIDLEPVFRPRTPIQRWPGLSNVSPIVSPEHTSVFDVFSQDASFRRPGSVMTRRIASLNKSSPSKILNDQATPEASEESMALGKLVEDAENNLKERSEVTEDPASEPKLHHDTIGPRTVSANTTKITYSKQRSFLVSSLEDTVADTASHALAPSSAIGTDEDEEDTDEQDAGKPSIKNLHDLRQGGENKRFADEISYLLEGLQSERSKQSALIELARKLSAKDFARRFKAAGFEVKVMTASQKSDDPVSLFALMIIISVLLQGVDSAVFTSKQKQLMKHAMLYDEDIATYLSDKRIKASKLNRISTQELRAHLESSEAFSHLSSQYRLSPRLLALMNLGYQIEHNADFVVKSILPLIKNYQQVSEILMVELQLISTMLETFKPETMSLASFPKSQIATLCEIVKMLLTARQENNDSRSTTICNILRFLIGLANSIPEMVPVIAKTEFVNSLLSHIESESRTSSDGDDDTVLCLGLLVCLAEESDHARTVMREQVAHNAPNSARINLLATLEARMSNDLVAGYIALLLFHLRREGISGNTDAGPTSKPGKKERDIIKAGLESLKQGTGEVVGLQTNLTMYISSL